MGKTLIVHSFEFTDSSYHAYHNNYIKHEDIVFPPSAFYPTFYDIVDLIAGFGLFTKVVLGHEWAPDWLGCTLVENFQVETVALNPVFAYKASDKTVGVFGGH